MLTKEILEARITEIKTAMEQIAMQHNSMNSRLEENKYLLSVMESVFSDAVPSDAVVVECETPSEACA
jgi:hypothetical protein